MPKLTIQIAYPVILAGLFVAVIFMAFNYQQLTLSFYITFVALIIYIFFFGFVTGQRFASPVKKILEKADNLSKGNFSGRLYLDNKDELGELAKAFNRIADNLEESKSEMEKAEKSVDIKVQARTEELQETINALEQKVKNRTSELQKMMVNIQKFQNDSKARELELSDLKTQISDMASKSPKKKPLVKKDKTITGEEV